MRKKTHEEYENELFEGEFNFLPLEQYKTANTPILHECINSHQWKVQPHSILTGHGCPYCVGLNKKTHFEYERQLLEREINYTPLETYSNSSTNILHICINEHIWKASPNAILKGKGCPYCANDIKTKTHQQYLKEIIIDAIPLEKYTGANVPISHKCGKNHEWKAKPAHILKEHGCPECANLNRPGGYNSTRFSRDRELANAPGILYVIVLVSKKTQERLCVKIGITKGTSNKDVLNRSKGFTGYEPRIQKLFHGTLEEAFNLEQQLHAKFKPFQYTSEWKFGGYSELFQIHKLQDILQSIPAKP